MVLLAFALNYLAMTALCLAMARHHRTLLQGAPSVTRQRVLRGLALLGLGLALLLCIERLGGEIGGVVWLCLLLLAGLQLVGLLAWRAHWVLPLAGLLSALGGLARLL